MASWCLEIIIVWVSYELVTHGHELGVFFVSSQHAILINLRICKITMISLG